MSDAKKLIRWLNNTQTVLDIYYGKEENTPKEVLNIKKLITDELSKPHPLISDSLMEQINTQLIEGVKNASNNKQSFFNLDLLG